MIELRQVGHAHLNRSEGVIVLNTVEDSRVARVPFGHAEHVLDDPIGANCFRRSTSADGPLHAFERVLREQLQDADVLPGPG